MNPEQQPQAHAKQCEDTIQELDEALRALNWQICRIEKMIRTALQQVDTVDLSSSVRGRPSAYRTATPAEHCGGSPQHQG